MLAVMMTIFALTPINATARVDVEEPKFPALMIRKLAGQIVLAMARVNAVFLTQALRLPAMTMNFVLMETVATGLGHALGQR